MSMTAVHLVMAPLPQIVYCYSRQKAQGTGQADEYNLPHNQLLYLLQVSDASQLQTNGTAKAGYAATDIFP